MLTFKGEMFPFFFFSVFVRWSVFLLVFYIFVFLGSVVEIHFRERILRFMEPLCFLVVFCLCFRFYVLAFRYRTCFENISSCQVSLFLCFACLSSGSRQRRLCSYVLKIYRSGNNTTLHPAPFWVLFFFPFLSHRGCVDARFGHASFFLAFSLGVPFWATRVFFSLGTCQ